MNLFSILLAPHQVFAKYTICTATINSPHESNIIRSQLSSKDFNFVELTDYGKEQDSSSSDYGGSRSSSSSSSVWFKNACEAGIKCDVLLISAHFGGSFFRKAGPFSLSVEDMQQNSCTNSCNGILKYPKEVFLFGCNTLASKEKDSRSPEQYLKALVEDGFSLIEAERIVAARYGPFGSSFKEQMEKIFEGIPIIYGFNSIGPSGPHVRKAFKKFIKKIGNYKRHLDELSVQKEKLLSTPTQRELATPLPASGQIWQRSMSAFNKAIAHGLLPHHMASYSVRENMCSLSNSNVSTTQLFRHALKLVESNLFLYAPSFTQIVNERIQNQIKVGMPDSELQLLVRDSSKNEMLKNQFRNLISSQPLSVSEKSDLLKTERILGWIDNEEYSTQISLMLDKLLKDPTREHADQFCSLIDQDKSLKKYVDVRFLESFTFTKPEHFTFLSCLHPKDENIARLALQGFYSMQSSKHLSRLDLAMSLVRILRAQGAENFSLPLVKAQLNYRGHYEKEVRWFSNLSLLSFLQGQELAEKLNELLRIAETSEDGISAYSSILDSLSKNENLDDNLIIYFLDKFFHYINQSRESFPHNNRQDNKSGLISISKYLITPRFQDWLGEHFSQIPSSFIEELSRLLLSIRVLKSEKLIDAMINQIEVSVKNAESFQDFSFFNLTSTLALNELNEMQIQKITDLYFQAQGRQISAIRHILFNQESMKYMIHHPSIDTQDKFFTSCEIDDDNDGNSNEYNCESGTYSTGKGARP